jgi:HSP20 family protein
MSNITRYDPLNELVRFNPLFADPFTDEIFNRFVLRPPAGSQMKMDLKEADGKYLVNAEMPGVSKDDIHVSIDGRRVSISAEVKQEKDVKEGERVISSERSYGMTSRSFTLATEVDQEQVTANYNNGVLELILPKKAGTGSRQIQIS